MKVKLLKKCRKAVTISERNGQYFVTHPCSMRNPKIGITKEFFRFGSNRKENSSRDAREYAREMTFRLAKEAFGFRPKNKGL